MPGDGAPRKLKAGIMRRAAAAFVFSVSLFAAPPAYVGSQTCQVCHEDVFNAFQTNPHHVVESDSKRGWKDKGCESCHGPGSVHAESGSAADIRNPAKLRPAESARKCLNCHLNEPTHVGRIQSSHAKDEIACVSCHTMHKTPEEFVRRKFSSINQQCAMCHIPAWAEFQRPFRHRLPEAAMSCVDCHNPHGSFRPKLLQTIAANEPGCFKCHGDKRGPFVFEHAPVRIEGCSSCHEPHGSANPRMLVRQEVRLACLECHANIGAPGAATNPSGTLGGVPPAFHDLRNPRFRNCTICHVKIHGSNVSRALLR